MHRKRWLNCWKVLFRLDGGFIMMLPLPARLDAPPPIPRTNPSSFQTPSVVVPDVRERGVDSFRVEGSPGTNSGSGLKARFGKIWENTGYQAGELAEHSPVVTGEDGCTRWSTSAGSRICDHRKAADKRNPRSAGLRVSLIADSLDELHKPDALSPEEPDS